MPTRLRAPTHWDFMLDAGSASRTWALADEPRAEQAIVAEQLADHRREYLDYEGPISGGRGSVTRWDEGEYTILAERGNEELTVALAGRRCIGLVTMRRLSSSEPSGSNRRWEFSFRLA